MGEKHTSLYISIQHSYYEKITQIMKKKNSSTSINKSKNEIVRNLLIKGIQVEEGKYLKLSNDLNDFVKQISNITLEKNGKKITYKRSIENVYYWLIEKGLKHMQD